MRMEANVLNLLQNKKYHKESVTLAVSERPLTTVRHFEGMRPWRTQKR